MDLGKELWRDECPEKYSEPKNGFFPGIITTIIVFVTNLFGNLELFQANIWVAIFVAAICSLFCFCIVFFMTRKVNDQYKGTYICVCEKGIYGCFNGGGKKKDFQLYYSELKNAKRHGAVMGKDLITIYAENKRDSVSLRLNNPARAADMINEKILSKKFFNK